eukprot:gnl/TRDRNA2_/TRDRNA2_175269_c1_seq2.p1 gnl/TRDRNA2_/TRDRNA2_175269_c1~~gnl/TRDRNA2_/TRDRNA2_175269_c1_seq2.p1  ORF type:complete len:224 (+),score=59.98 gnl/TRDRNA2_/TRDRNA2_175269_c1_seq2:100-672(+)
MDGDGDDKITKAEFLEALQVTDAARALQYVGVDAVELVDYADFIFSANGPTLHATSQPHAREGDLNGARKLGLGLDEDERLLTFEQLMGVILQFRGASSATVKDIVDLRKYLRNEMVQQHNELLEVFNAIMETEERLDKVACAVELGRMSFDEHFHQLEAAGTKHFHQLEATGTMPFSVRQADRSSVESV